MSQKRPNPKGVYCPSCRGVRLVVSKVTRPCPGVCRRYRRCSACGAKVVTEERAVKK